MFCKRSLISGWASARAISLLIWCSMARGVPAGASHACEPSRAAPGSTSDRAGTSGSNAVRVGSTASGSRRPSLIIGIDGPSPATPYCTRPAMTSMRNSGCPLNATCTALMPATSRKRSPFICVPLPAPAEPKNTLPGCACASAIKSFTDFTPSEGATTSASVLKPMLATAEKSFNGSYGRLGCIAAVMAKPGDTASNV